MQSLLPTENKDFGAKPFLFDLSSGLDLEELEWEGERIYYRKGLVPVSIRLDPDQEDAIVLMPGGSLQVHFKKIWISADAFPEVIELLISSPASVGISGGEIALDQTQLIWSSQGRAFVGGEMVSSASGKYSMLSLTNPANSGVLAIVESIKAGEGGSTKFVLHYYEGSPLGVCDVVNEASMGSKLLGGQNGECVVYKVNHSSILGTQILQSFLNYQYTENIILNDGQKFIIKPGFSLIVSNTSAGTLAYHFFEWIEAPCS